MDAVTWIGHATVLVELGGTRVMTDPVLTDRVAHLRRRRPLSVPRDGGADVALVSHVHLDHLHLRSLKYLDPSTPVVVPAGAGRLVARTGLTTVHEVRPGDELVLGGVTVRAVPARHKRGRGPHSRVSADPMGFVLERDGTSVYFAGDTDLFDGMAAWAGVTVALLPIWGWGPSIGVGHLDPERAASATRLIDPRYVIPIHWGTLTPEDGRRRIPTWFETPADLFTEHLQHVGLDDRLRLLRPGDGLELPEGAIRRAPAVGASLTRRG